MNMKMEQLSVTLVKIRLMMLIVCFPVKIRLRMKMDQQRISTVRRIATLQYTYSQDTTFAVLVSNGLTKHNIITVKILLTMTHQPSTIWMEVLLVSKTQTTTNTYGKTVKDGYAAPTPTVTTVTDNQAKDVLTTTRTVG